MKWSRSNKMKESFNCITHPLSTSCGELSSPSAGMDLVMNRWRTILLQMMVCWMVHTGFISCSLPVPPLQTQPSPKTDLSHRKCLTHTFFQLQNKPGYQKTIDVPLSSAILHKVPSLWWEFRCQLHTQRQSRAQILTRANHYLWHQKNKADSEMPPHDFREELIYSI